MTYKITYGFHHISNLTEDKFYNYNNTSLNIQAYIYIYIYIYISKYIKVKLATIVDGDPKAPFSIAYYTKV